MHIISTPDSSPPISEPEQRPVLTPLSIASPSRTGSFTPTSHPPACLVRSPLLTQEHNAASPAVSAKSRHVRFQQTPIYLNTGHTPIVLTPESSPEIQSSWTREEQQEIEGRRNGLSGDEEEDEDEDQIQEETVISLAYLPPPSFVVPLVPPSEVRSAQHGGHITQPSERPPYRRRDGVPSLRMRHIVFPRRTPAIPPEQEPEEEKMRKRRVRYRRKRRRELEELLNSDHDGNEDSEEGSDSFIEASSGCSSEVVSSTSNSEGDRPKRRTHGRRRRSRKDKGEHRCTTNTAASHRENGDGHDRRRKRKKLKSVLRRVFELSFRSTRILEEDCHGAQLGVIVHVSPESARE